MSLPKNCTATKACSLLVLLFAGAAAHAESIGTVTDLNGSLLVKRASGTIKVLAVNSSLEQGDTLATRAGTFARLSLTDRSDVVLGPDTELKIEKYSFHEASRPTDAAALSLAKGRVRIAAGLLGRRTNGGFTLATPSATIEIRDSTFIADYVAPDRTDVAGLDTQGRARPEAVGVAASYTATAVFKHVSMRSFNTQAPLLLAQNIVPNGATGRAPGLYVQVIDGAINLSNSGGTQNFAAGQFGFTANLNQPPIILPANPGMQFTPPPSFSSTTGSQGSTGGAKPGSVNCQVR